MIPGDGDRWVEGPGWAGPPPGADPAETLAAIREELAKLAPAPVECSRGQAKRCAQSVGARCTCRCGGRNHGALLAQLAFDFVAERVPTLRVYVPPALADAARRP